MNKYKVDINSFNLIEQIQNNEFTSVSVVKHKNTEKNYVAKVFRINNEEITPKIIERQLGILMRLQHPTLIKLIGYSLTDFSGNKNLTIIMKYSQRGSLDTLLKNAQNGFSDNDYDNTTRQIILIGIARGMMYLHQHNIIHRSLKPENILLCKKLHPHITDFNLSNLVQPPEIILNAYLAPETIEKNRYELKSDVYSFGIIMYEIISQSTPFPDFENGTLKPSEFRRKLVAENYRPEFDDTVPESFSKLIDRCLSRDPKERPSFEELFKKLAYNTSNDDDEGENYFLEDVEEGDIFDYIDKITANDTVYGDGLSVNFGCTENKRSSENSEDKIESSFYSARSFPLLLMGNDSDMITEKNLLFSDVYLLNYRSSKKKLNINSEKFIATLTAIFSGDNDLIKTRSFLLLFLFKNVLEIYPFFSFLLKKLKPNELEKCCFNSFFYDELARHQLLMLDVIESINHFITDCAFQYERICPFMVKIIVANENSLTPIPSNKIDFLDEEHVGKNVDKVKEKYPQILPFSIRFKEYCEVMDHDVYTKPLFDALLIVGFDKKDLNKNPGELIDFAFTEIVKPKFDLFILRNNFYWFKYHKEVTAELSKKYLSFGILFGFALSMMRPIPIRFPRYFYKKLQNRSFSQSDLMLYDTDFFRESSSLFQKVITEKDFLSFTYLDNLENCEIDLIKLNDITDDLDFVPTPLVESNKADYVNRVIQWMSISIDKEFKAFENGLKSMNLPPLFPRYFRLDELDKIVSGETEKNWNELKKEAVYEGFDNDSQTVVWFWNYFFDMSEEKKLKILKFITGTSAVPIGGLKNIQITFNHVNGGSMITSDCSTCKINLPDFESFKQLKDKMNKLIV
ncbi:hypothetical protein M9Y10_015513 [Tritrichomonas musculus]|uniref:Protein kinase domain-containing protein n=1 Tax=Tritrichomonas musculus TaxID=1915356 RepID=A0ABR2L2G4_9EUKA